MNIADREQSLGRIVTFYSFKGGTGRTMALANLAWILASSGQRVLTVDWDLESPGLHRYFHPFLTVDKDLRDSPGVIDMVREYAATVTRPSEDQEIQQAEIDRAADIQRFATSLEYEFPGQGAIDLVPAGRQTPAYSEVVSTFDWDVLYRRLGGAPLLEALRREMRRQYDWVLIDSRTGLSDTAGICTLQLPDVVVVCFTMSTQSIDGAVAVARSIRNQRREPIQVFPVPMRVEDGELGKLDRSRGYARQRLETFVRALGHDDVEKYWGSVEIPHKVFYAYEEILATFGDRARQEGSLLAAYERLAGVITGTPCELPPMPEASRQRWLAEFERRSPVTPIRLVISYAARDRMWAEWIEAQLADVGQPGTLRTVSASVEAIDEADRMLVLLSQDYLRSRDAARVWRRGLSRDQVGPGRFLVPVRVDGSPLPPSYDLRNVVDVTRPSAARARGALLDALDLPNIPAHGDGPGASPPRPRFPATPPRISNVPNRNPTFTGRDAILESLRGELSRSGTAAPVALSGLGGIGKTQIALEYAHRMAADYDIVWWITADQTPLIRTRLAELALRLGLPTGENTTQQMEVVLEELRQRTEDRWLIVFDNAGDKSELAEFLPQGTGHVIITSRNAAAWTQAGVNIEVGVFNRAESIELLSRKVPALSLADAEAVAEKLGDLPLVMETAAAYLATTAMPATAFLEQLVRNLPQVLDQQPPPGYPHTAAATWRLSLEGLRQHSRAAAKLLELCAFFAPEPIPISWLSSPRMINLLVDFDPALRDPLLHGSLTRDIGRYGLARVDPATNTIRVHNLVQSVVRNELDSEARRESRVHVLETLAANRPDADDRDSWSSYEDLRRHLEPAEALASQSDEVRQLVVDVVRYLRLRGDLTGSQELADRALDVWSTTFAADDTLVLRLRFELANTLRAQGQNREAFDVDQDVHTKFLRKPAFGEDHAYTLMAAGGMAGDLRGLGRYREARDLDEPTLTRWQRAFGDDHSRTLMAQHNLAITFRLVGDFAGAARLDEETLRRRSKVLGGEHLWTLHSANSWGRDLREMGDFARSRELLSDTMRSCAVKFGDDHTLTLQTAKSLAVTLRRLGELETSRTLTADTLQRYEKVRGGHHPDTVLCALELACVLSALGRHDEARSRAEDVITHSRTINGELHPVTLAAANDMAIFLMRAGDFDKARVLAEETADRFIEILGEYHPYTLTSHMNLGNLCHAIGELNRARQLDETSYEQLRAQLGEEHPTVLAAEANLAISQRDTRVGQDALTRLDNVAQAFRRVLGEEHPNTAAVRKGERINSDIEPPPT
ncbi:MAG TPA: FxSxx-COOH system tetratricopeptide repeat protein [Micromonosporaceae bacterium]|nr:FxSxx-COOH system tetratricopeptide repeat protein [Micromonosporaceae bacterium]